MANFAHFDENGFPVAFYSEDVMGYKKIIIDEKITYDDEGRITGVTPVVGDNPNCKIPNDAIELSDDQYAEFLKFSGMRKWVDGRVVEVNLPEATIDDFRRAMPDKTPREFRDILIDEGKMTDAIPDEVTVAIQQIPFDKERAKALNAWQNPTMFSRSDPYIDMIGAMFGYTPEDIDRLWIGDNES